MSVYMEIKPSKAAVTESSYDIPRVLKCTRWVHGPTTGVGSCTQRLRLSTLGMSYELPV
jgi:hypothetical protein